MPSNLTLLGSGRAPYIIAAGGGGLTLTNDYDSNYADSDTNLLTANNVVVAADDDYILLVAAVNRSAVTVNSSAFGAEALTEIGSVNLSGRHIFFYELITPTPGTQNCTIEFSDDVNGMMCVFVFKGAHQTDPTSAIVSDTEVSGTSISVDISSAAGEIVVSVIHTSPVVPSVGAGQTQKFAGNSSSNDQFVKGGTEDGAATVTSSYTFASTEEAIVAAIAVKPA